MSTNDTKSTTAIAPQQTRQIEKPIASFRATLDKMRGQLALALPKHVDLDRMLRIVFTTVQRTPLLLECTQSSLLGAIMQCAQLGLEPDGLLGHAYLVPFKNKKENRIECQLIIGYKGLLKLARQSGEVASVSARVVYSRDLFEYEYGLQEKLRHIPCEDNGDGPGERTHVYAIFRFKDGSHHFEVMTMGEVETIRRGSPSGTSPAWRDHYDEMCKKTAIRRAAKLSPASVEDRMARAISLDERADAGIPQNLDGGIDDALPAQPRQPAIDGKRQPLRRPSVDVPPPGGLSEDQLSTSEKEHDALDAADGMDPEDRRGDDPTRDHERAMPSARQPGDDDDERPDWAGGKK